MKRTAFLQQVVRQLRQTAEARQLGRASDAELLRRVQTGGDPEAFEAIVRRYGACVLAACRKVLPSEADAEDAFQATFLALLQNARAVRQPEMLRGWLAGVAHRVALKALAASVRHRRAERRKPTATAEAPDLSWREACAILHEELDRLPDKYRLPLLLCYLEGKSRDEAAQQLGVKTAVLHGRLQRGRDRLRARLLKRGVALSAGLLAVVVANSVTAGGPPEPLLRATLTAATTGRTSAAVAALVHGVSPMTLGKFKLLAVALLAVGLLVGSITLRMRGAPPPEPMTEATQLRPTQDPDEAAEAAEPPATDEKDSITYGGRVLGPDGKPVAGAKLYLTHAVGYLGRPSPSPEYATTGSDGRFKFTASKAKFGDKGTVVAATSATYGVGWVTVQVDGKRDDLALQLVEDDVPITGQIVDLEGKPVRGATLTVLQINAAPKEDLGPWLEAAKDKNGVWLTLEQEHLPRYTVAVSPKVTTDAEGRFRLTGTGSNRLVWVLLEGPALASQKLTVLTRSGKAIEVTEHKGRPEYGDPRTVRTYYGADFRHVAAPTKPIVGVVRDKDTKKPFAGVTIYSYKMANNPTHFFDSQAIVRTTTDAEGRYRLTGMPKGDGNKVLVMPPDDVPYVPVHAEVRDSFGLEPVTLDFELKRGVWIEGKITDKVTGKPLQAHVEYLSLYDNPHLLRDYPGFAGTNNRIVTAKEDGSYRIAGLPGPGLVGVRYSKGHYLRVSQRDDEDAIKETELDTAPFHLSFPDNYWALARIDPAKGAESVKRDVTLDPGRTFTVKVLGPDGKPLSGGRAFGQVDNTGKSADMKTAEFTVRGVSRRRPGQVLFQHPEKNLVGVAKPPKDDGGAVTVKLEPGATVTGRLVDADGKPRAGVELNLSFGRDEKTVWHTYMAERVRTDGEGRFRIAGLLPGQEFRLSDRKRIEGELSLGNALRPGETKDLGDVWLKRADE
jgi:RNA polymerase sigma factor (sigma-70 family)